LAHGALARISHARARRVARDVLVGLGFGPSPAIKVVAVAWLVADFLYRADTGKVHEEAALQFVTDIWVRDTGRRHAFAARVMLADVRILVYADNLDLAPAVHRNLLRNLGIVAEIIATGTASRG
jgi:hypothetical protein